MKRIYLAGGCFWGVEKYVSLIPGIIKTQVGYANGRTENPTYEDVRYRNSGHAETVEASFDPDRLELSSLLELFFDVIDPTSLNRQGDDEGIQYRTGIYYLDESDKDVIAASLDSLQKKMSAPVVVETAQIKNFYPAEEYHQKYLDKNPDGYCHIGADSFAGLQERLQGKSCQSYGFSPGSKHCLIQTS